MGGFFAALLALDEVTRVVLGGGDRLAAYFGAGGELSLDLAAGLALRSVPLYPVAFFEIPGHRMPLPELGFQESYATSRRPK